VVCGSIARNSTEWYDPKVNKWLFGPDMISPRYCARLAVVNYNFVFAVGGCFESPLQFVDMLDLSSESPCWKPAVYMLVRRDGLGVGVINKYLYAVSYVEIKLIPMLVLLLL